MNDGRFTLVCVFVCLIHTTVCNVTNFENVVYIANKRSSGYLWADPFPT